MLASAPPVSILARFNATSALPDHHTEQRHAWLRALQGLPGPVPAGFTTGRKSDFARPRRTLTICLAVIAAAIVYASSLPTYERTQPATVRAMNMRRTVCDADCQRFARPIRRFA